MPLGPLIGMGVAVMCLPWPEAPDCMLKWGGHFPPQGLLPPLTLLRGPSRLVGRLFPGMQDAPGTSDCDGSCCKVLAMIRATRMHAQMVGSFPTPRVPYPLGPCLEGPLGGWAGHSQGCMMPLGPLIGMGVAVMCLPWPEAPECMLLPLKAFPGHMGYTGHTLGDL